MQLCSERRMLRNRCRDAKWGQMKSWQGQCETIDMIRYDKPHTHTHKHMLDVYIESKNTHKYVERSHREISIFNGKPNPFSYCPWSKNTVQNTFWILSERVGFDVRQWIVLIGFIHQLVAGSLFCWVYFCSMKKHEKHLPKPMYSTSILAAHILQQKHLLRTTNGLNARNGFPFTIMMHP